MRKPDGALPAATRAKHRTPGFEPVIERRDFRGPPGRFFLHRKTDGILALIGFHCLCLAITAGGIIGVAARIETPHVPFGLALDDHVSHDLARPARLHDAEGEGAGLKGIAQSRNRAKQGQPVGRVRDRPVDDSGNAGAGQQRHPGAGFFYVGFQSFKIIGEKLEGKVFGHVAVRPAGAGKAMLVGAQQQAMAFLTQVVTVIGIAQQRQLCRACGKFRNFGCDHILVFNHHGGKIASHHRGNGGRVIASSIDDDVRLD